MVPIRGHFFYLHWYKILIMSSKNRTLLQSIFGMKCPKCRQADLFTSKSMYNIKELAKMPQNCPVCDQLFMPEPGFYYGAMFISYIMTGFAFLGFIGICMFVFNLSVDTSFILLGVAILLTFTWIFRISRSLWIHINVKYNPEIARKVD